MTERETRIYEQQAQRLVADLAEGIYPASVDLQAECCTTDDPVRFVDRTEQTYRSIVEGEVWGRTWQSGWFRLRGVVPVEWAGSTIVARLNFGSEACVFDAEGTPVQGLTNGSVFVEQFQRDRYGLLDPCSGGETVDLWVETAANGLFGINLLKNPPRDDPGRHGSYEARVEAMRLSVMDPQIQRLTYDAAVLADLMRGLPPDGVRRARIRRCLCRAANVRARGGEWRDEVQALLAVELGRRANASSLGTVAVGHAHIDTGWLWPVRETIRKCARTFSSQLDLIRKYPDYVFGASQPQHYQFVKDHYPRLYQGILRAVEAGRWEVQGAMWVEADCNVPSGESLVRQILLGKNFFMDEFGVDVKNLWLPDVFGYSAALPQILKRSGVDFFLTQKMSWSQFNRFPHHTFVWQGIDGSEVITHFPPEGTYNSLLTPSGLRKAEAHFQEKAYLEEFATLFGVGDGGGGPMEEHVEMGLRQRDLEGSPRVSFGKTQDLLDRIATRRPELPRWEGELYLELHRGTLTTQARNKRYNRLLEQRFAAVEILYSCADLAGYPVEEIRDLWKQLLINQFHDILPGSSINMVYRDSLEQYATVEQALQTLEQKAGAMLFAEDEGTVTLVNTLSTPFDDPVFLPEGWAGGAMPAGGVEPLDSQMEKGRTVIAIEVPPLSAVTLVPAPLTETAGGEAARAAAREELILENEKVRYELAADGTVIRAYDKEARREALAGDGNVLTLYDDRPLEWDAWDVDIFYEEQAIESARSLRWSRVADGPVRQGLRFELEVGSSSIIQEVYLSASKRLDFHTTVEWRERRKMLRVAFHSAVRAAEASYEIQFGAVRRPTHRNTTWEMARFEAVGHRFADLSDDEFGVALLNDCKYGYKVLGSTLDLNLLRAPVHPDPDADLGTQEFTYALLPHVGRLSESEVGAEAAKLNRRPAVFAGRRSSVFAAPLTVEGDGVVLDTLKRGEQDACVVARVYESKGRDATCTLRTRDPGDRVFETSIMEWDEEEIDTSAGQVEIALGPYEIRTFKIRNRFADRA